jgi:anti-sigma B factor antagonist
MKTDSHAGDGGSVDPRIFLIERDLDMLSVAQLKSRLLDHLRSHGPQIWIDLSQVTFVDSTGLGLLVLVLREARQAGGHVGLLHPTRQVRRVLQVAGIEPFFQAGPPG